MPFRYSSDLTDDQWRLIESLLPERLNLSDGLKNPCKGGRPRTWSLREIFNAIFYIEKTGCQWRMIPSDLPPKETVWGHFRQFRDDGTLEVIRIALNKKRRVKVGKEETPSVLIADSQSVKTGQKGGISHLLASGQGQGL
jgi:putative transposase